MIIEHLLSKKYRFKEDSIPNWLTKSQLEARELFLDEIHNKDRYVDVGECPYCGNSSFIKISEVNKRGLPSDIVICDSCNGCFKSKILDSEATRFYYDKISHTLVGKSSSQSELEARFKKRIQLFAYPRYRFVSHFIELIPERDLIAEFGCNDGANLVPWKENGFTVIGIDLDSRMVELGKSKGLNLIKADMLDFEFASTRPKLIIISHSLDRVADLNAFLSRMGKILEPDGYIFIETPGIKSHGVVNTLKYFDVECNYYFELSSMTRILKRHLFKIIYADEYMRIICTPSQNQSILKPEPTLLSLDKIRALLLKKIIDKLAFLDKKLYDLLKDGEKGNIKIRILNKLQGLYFRYFYDAVIKSVKGGHIKRTNGRTNEVASRFLNEELGIHWQVDETKESFNRLLYHLEVKTNEKPYFKEALNHLNLNNDEFRNGLVAADIGAGVCWASAILARHPKVKVVYAVDPSDNRLKHASYVIKHLGVENKVKIERGTFLNPNIAEKVDIILLCGSFHHCYDEQIDGLFSNMRHLLKPNGKILITNEHYINWLFVLKRLLSYLKHFSARSSLYYYPVNKLRAPDPFSGDHWRSRKEIEKIFKKHRFVAQFFVHDGNLLSKKKNSLLRFGWHFYHAILGVKNGKDKS